MYQPCPITSRHICSVTDKLLCILQTIAEQNLNTFFRSLRKILILLISYLWTICHSKILHYMKQEVTLIPHITSLCAS